MGASDDLKKDPAGGGDAPAARFERRVPEGDDRTRLVCSDCGFVNYENPKIVVGSVAAWEDRILLCRRAIEPRRGFWTLPAGYLELHEEAAEGARREAWEEARARLEIDQLLAVYSIPRISQIQLIFRARLATPEVAAGPETLELDLFDWKAIPWDQLAFPSVRWALEDYRAVRDQPVFAPRGNPPGEDGGLSHP
ncbi:NUDIX hydrolase [Pelagibius marinus]|uniref:NUDIX hydrolase n=1 Tax=Pelagibius marinus TaxID=2762760 RepID=UPI001872B23D|nr:NUDIX hydrolase [Pelagibius marinus]